MNKIYYVFSLLLLCSCATDIDFHVPLNRFESPEVNGKFLKGNVDIGFGSSHKITTAEVVESIFPSTFDPTVTEGGGIERSAHLSSSFSLGLLKRLDFVFKSHGDGAEVWGAKFQFLGSVANESSNGWKGSLQLTKGSMSENEGTLNVSLRSGGTRNYDGYIEVETYDASLNFGYRFNKYLITYLNSVYSYYDSESTMSSNSFATIYVNGIVRTYGGLLGVRFGKHDQNLSVIVESGLMYSTWEGDISETSVPIGASFSYNW